MKKKLLVLNVAGLGKETADQLAVADKLSFQPATPPFPAVTCTAQATFRTGLNASGHGMIANGFYDRTLRKAFFWEQSSAVVEGRRIWQCFREAGNKVGILFWQQSLGEEADIVLSPAPIHKHHGGMIMDCYSLPRNLYPRLLSKLGKFKLRHYWGPAASPKVGDWIATATGNVMENDGPELLLSYLPTLDYDMQRNGPDPVNNKRSFDAVSSQLNNLVATAESAGYDWVIWGDYCITKSARSGAIFPNRLLAEEGLLKTRTVGGRVYPDLYASRAFAMVDHAVAHVYVRDAADIDPVASLLRSAPGISSVLMKTEKKDAGIAHPRSGEMVLVAGMGAWFAYPWWKEKQKAPDFASHVDIHNKPGFDPCELNFQWLPPGVSTNTAGIRGTHGRPDKPVAWSSSISFDKQPGTLRELSVCTGKHLERMIS